MVVLEQNQGRRAFHVLFIIGRIQRDECVANALIIFGIAPLLFGKMTEYRREY